MSKLEIALVKNSGNEGTITPFVYSSAKPSSSQLQIIRTARPHIATAEILPPLPSGEDLDSGSSAAHSRISEVEAAYLLFDEDPRSIFLDIVA